MNLIMKKMWIFTVKQETTAADQKNYQKFLSTNTKNLRHI